MLLLFVEEGYTTVHKKVYDRAFELGVDLQVVPYAANLGLDQLANVKNFAIVLRAALFGDESYEDNE